MRKGNLMYMDTESDRAQRQRDFYVKLTPHQGGQILAGAMGFTIPGIDSQEAELKDSMTLWFSAHASGAADYINDAAWWMTSFMDKPHRMSREQFEHRADELSSFAVAILGQLIDNKVVQWVTAPEIPELRTSTHQLIDEVDQGVLDRLDATLDEPWS